MTRAEWRWAAMASALVMVLTMLPYLAGLQASSPDWHFSGFVFGVGDGNSYIGKMAEGARGAWLFHLFYTTERHQGIVAFSFHLLLGKLAMLVARPGDPIAFHDRLVTWYHGARLACGFALLLMSYRFCAEFLPLRSQRRLAFFFIAVGGGLGWLALLIGYQGLPLEIYSPEAYTFLDLYGLPHLAAARALLLAGFLVYLPTSRPGSAVWPLRAGLAAGGLFLVMGLVQPLYLIVGYAVLGAHIATLWLLRRPLRRPLIAASVAGGVSAPLAAYTSYVFHADPILAQWQRQNIISSPPPLDYLLGWGLWLLPALLFLALCLRRSCRAKDRVLFLVGWLAVVPIMVYLPYNLQRRFAEGAQLPLVCLGVLGLTAGLRGRLRRGAQRMLAAAAAALSVPGTLILLVGGFQAATRPGPPMFVPGAEIAAFRWIGQHVAPGSAVLTTFEIGNALPAYAPVIVYLGHGPETAFEARKQGEVDRFFQMGDDEDFRRALLQAGSIRYVLADRPPDAEGFNPSEAPYLQLEMSAGEYEVYRVTLEASQ
jgi:hypothetical protein